jgi:dTDP-glucose 4,6-dehydratase
MRVLVTGGAGFIGSHFVRAAVAGAYPGLGTPEITVLDAFTYAGNRGNLPPAGAPGAPRVVTGDITDAVLVDGVMRGQDAVVHFAAESHVDRSITGSAVFMTTNVLGTHTLLEAAHRHGVRTFVHVSTDEVYGSIDTGSWPEDHRLEPTSPYAASKAAADLVALSYHRTHGLDVRVTRASNTYGSHQFPEKLLPLFITNLLDGLPVPVYGDGTNRREWLHAADHCRAVALVLTDGRAGRVYNVGGGVELSNRELTGHLLDAFGAGPEMIDWVADRKAHDRRYALDSSAIRAELGFVPRHDLRAELPALIRWYAGHRQWWEPLVKRSVGQR